MVGATEAGATKAGVEGNAEVATAEGGRAATAVAEAEAREASRRPSGRALTYVPRDDVRDIDSIWRRSQPNRHIEFTREHDELVIVYTRC